MKFEDRSQEEIERQERCARGDAWRMAQNILELKETDKATFFSPTTEWCLPAPSQIKLWEREFVVDSGPSVHMLSGKDLNSAEWETVRVSRSPTTVVTANGEVPTKEEATVYVKELDLFVRVKLLDDTPAVLSLRKLCQDLGYSYEWTTGQKPQLIKDGGRIRCNTANYVPIVVPGLSTGSSTSATRTSPTSLSQEAVFPTQHPASTRSESTSGIERVRGDPSRDLPELSEEFKENLVDESVPEHRDAPANSSRESASETRGKVVSGKHSLYSLPGGPKLRHLPENQNNSGSLQKTHRYSRASSGKFW